MIIASASFTRPADTTQYASGDLIANSATNTAVAPLTWTVTPVPGGCLSIRRVRIKKTDAGVTGCTIRVHLYTTNPCTTAPTNGDNGAWATKIAGYVGYFDVVVANVFNDGAAGAIAPPSGTEEAIVLGGTQTTLYGLLEARGTYTPASAEVFTVELECYPLQATA